MSFESARVPTRLFRLSRQSDPTALTAWRWIDVGAGGRWDDPLREYRVLYTANSEVGAYVEVLQDLRPSAGATALLDAIDDDGDYGDTLAEVDAAARDRLRAYYFAALIPSERDVIVDVAAPGSRSEIQARLVDDFPDLRLKRGDFNGSDYDFTQAVSRSVYTAAHGNDERFAGIMAESAEHDGTRTYAYFETGRETDVLRGDLYAHFVRQALDEDDFVRAALAYLTAGA